MVPYAPAVDIGATLRAAREQLRISVEEAAWRTRVKPDYLRALEDERFSEIGHHAIARRHLHIYARYLGLDADALAADYRRRFENSEPSPIERLNEQVKEARKPQKPKWLIAALLSSAVLIAASLTGVVRGPGPRTTSAGGTLATLPPSLQAPNPSPAPAVQAPVPPGSPVTIAVAAGGRSWVRITVDGEVAFEGILTAGMSKAFDGTQRVDVVVGNTRAIRLTVNGKEVVPTGSGGVYRASFGPRGEIVPQ